MNLNKTESQPSDQLKPKKQNNMKEYVIRTILVWAFIIFAFFLGNNFDSINTWGCSQYIMIAVLIFSMVGIAMSIDT